jgi:hypothetical protein
MAFGDVPPTLHQRFSALELATRIDKLSEKDGAEALAQVIAGTTLSSLTGWLRELSAKHVETSTSRRSRAAANRPDRDRTIARVLGSAVERMYGASAQLRRFVNGPSYVKCHFVAEIGGKVAAGFTVINCAFKTGRQVEEAVSGALFSASRFAEYYVVLIEGEQFLVRVDSMIDYLGRPSVGLAEIKDDVLICLREPESVKKERR